MNHDKAQIGMVTRNMPHLVIVIFSDEVVKLNFSLPCLDWYLFSVLSGNRYLPRGSRENVLSTTIIWECSYVQIGSAISNHTILDSFRKNSNMWLQLVQIVCKYNT